MVYEMRTYRLRTGTLPEYLRLVEEEGIAVQAEHLGHLVEYFFSEIGRLNEIVHIWAYAVWTTASGAGRRWPTIPLGRVHPQDPGADRGNGVQDPQAGAVLAPHLSGRGGDPP